MEIWTVWNKANLEQQVATIIDDLAKIIVYDCNEDGKIQAFAEFRECSKEDFFDVADYPEYFEFNQIQ